MSPKAGAFRAGELPRNGGGAEEACHRRGGALRAVRQCRRGEHGPQELCDLDSGRDGELPGRTGYVATKAWAKKYPQTMAAFLDALREGQQIADTRRDAVEQAMEKLPSPYTVPPSIASVMSLETYPLSIAPDIDLPGPAGGRGDVPVPDADPPVPGEFDARRPLGSLKGRRPIHYAVMSLVEKLAQAAARLTTTYTTWIPNPRWISRQKTGCRKKSIQASQYRVGR